MTMLIIGRTFQGVGGGAIVTMSEIIIADLVPLKDRGFYQGIYAGLVEPASRPSVLP